MRSVVLWTSDSPQSEREAKCLPGAMWAPPRKEPEFSEPRGTSEAPLRDFRHLFGEAVGRAFGISAEQPDNDLAIHIPLEE